MKTDSIITKVAAIHDLSGFGRASLTTVIPVLSTMGIQTCPVPTAVLSTHSGGFEGYTFKDLTDEIPGYINHWKKLGLSFNCIYSGFLGSAKQIAIVMDMIKSFRTEDNLVVIDPVLGDNEALYSSISKDMVPEMRKLIAFADIITPNFTEAKILLDTKELPSIATGKKWLKELSNMGPNTVIITSFPGNDDSLNTIAYDKENEEYWIVPTKLLPVNYPGTGDLFTSVLIGCMMNGENLPISTAIASKFVYECIETSSKFDYPRRDGVLLEQMLPELRKPFVDLVYNKI
ncbi:MAG: pyridoxamine kinase [Peptostreptococcaceae bacterium]|nr:pyridoxamine kinase [Peptostreptococcaceae bacterium]